MKYTEEEFTTLLDVLANDLLDANHHYCLYNNLLDALNKYEYEINTHIGFWGLTLDAHYSGCLLCLCRAYDNNREGTLSLKNLLEIIQGNTNIFDIERFKERLKKNPYVDRLAQSSRKPNEEQVKKDIEFVSNTNPLVKKLSKLRGSYIAHRNTKVTLKGTVDPDQLTWKEVGQLIKTGLHIFNNYRQLFEASTHSSMLIGENHYQDVLKHIRIGRKAIKFITAVKNESQINGGFLEPNDTTNKVFKFINDVQQDLYPDHSKNTEI